MFPLSCLTNPVSSLSADGGCALDVGSGGRHVVVPAQLSQKVFDQIDEDQISTGHHEVAQSHDGPLKESHDYHHANTVTTDVPRLVLVPVKEMLNSVTAAQPQVNRVFL